MPAPASRRGASPALCPNKRPRHVLRGHCRHLPPPIAAKVRPYPAGRSGNLFSFGIQRLPRCFRFLRRGASALLRLAATQVFPQLNGQAMAAVNRLPGLAVVWRARHGHIIGLPPDGCQPDPLLAPPGVVWQFPPRLRDFIFCAPCCRSSVVEHPLGKGEVECSIHTGSTMLTSIK